MTFMHEVSDASIYAFYNKHNTFDQIPNTDTKHSTLSISCCITIKKTFFDGKYIAAITQH